MPLQTSVNLDQALGVVGELRTDAPWRAAPFILNSADASYNVFGRAFTVSSEGVAAAGGTGVFAGILIDPKQHVTAGTVADGALAPNLVLRNAEVASLLQMGEVIVAVAGAAVIGDRVYYDNTTGILGTVSDAVGVGSIATTVLTIASVNPGSGNFGIGSNITGPNILPNTHIVSLGTGTGGVGTYNVNQSQTAASGTVRAEGLVPAGKTRIVGASIWEYTPTAAGLAVMKIVN